MGTQLPNGKYNVPPTIQRSKAVRETSTNGRHQLAPPQISQIQQISAVVDDAVTDFDVQPVGPRSAERFQHFDDVLPDYDLWPAEQRSVPRSHNCADVAHHASPTDAQRSHLAVPGFLLQRNYFCSTPSTALQHLWTRRPTACTSRTKAVGDKATKFRRHHSANFAIRSDSGSAIMASGQQRSHRLCQHPSYGTRPR